MAKTALIITDMLHDFIDPEGALFCGPHCRQIIAPIAGLLQQHRDMGSLIVFVQDCHAPDDKEFALFAPHCLAGEKGSQIIPELAPRAQEKVLPKTRYSAFFGTDLEDILLDKQVRQVHLCGVCTSICVMETCSDLSARDYRVVLHTNAVSDFDIEAHDFAIKRMQNILGAELV